MNTLPKWEGVLLSFLGWVRGSTKAFVNQKELSYQSSVDDLKTSVSNGKSAVASAITDKGVSTSATATFDTMAQNIRNIKTGYDITDFNTKSLSIPGNVNQNIKNTFSTTVDTNDQTTTSFDIRNIYDVGGNGTTISFELVYYIPSYAITYYSRISLSYVTGNIQSYSPTLSSDGYVDGQKQADFSIAGNWASLDATFTIKLTYPSINPFYYNARCKFNLSNSNITLSGTISNIRLPLN